MKELIEALQIFAKYQENDYPTHCEHDTLHIMGITEEEVSEEDMKKLDELGFFYSEEDDGFISFKYGSS